MPLESKYPGKCKDCGTAYLAGAMIDQNSKGHWCRNGMNCMGTMQLQGTAPPLQAQQQNTQQNEPTPEEYLQIGKTLVYENWDGDEEFKDELIKKLRHKTIQKTAKYIIRRGEIERIMNELGIKHPSRVSFIEGVLGHSED